MKLKRLSTQKRKLSIHDKYSPLIIISRTENNLYNPLSAQQTSNSSNNNSTTNLSGNVGTSSRIENPQSSLPKSPLRNRDLKTPKSLLGPLTFQKDGGFSCTSSNSASSNRKRNLQKYLSSYDEEDSLRYSSDIKRRKLFSVEKLTQPPRPDFLTMDMEEEEEEIPLIRNLKKDPTLLSSSPKENSQDLFAFLKDSQDHSADSLLDSQSDSISASIDDISMIQDLESQIISLEEQQRAFKEIERKKKEQETSNLRNETGKENVTPTSPSLSPNKKFQVKSSFRSPVQSPSKLSSLPSSPSSNLSAVHTPNSPHKIHIILPTSSAVNLNQELQSRITKALTDPRLKVLHESGAIGSLERKYLVAGSSGSNYTVILNKEPECNCPDFTKGKRATMHCKHIHLNLPRWEPCLFRRKILSSELYKMFYQPSKNLQPTEEQLPSESKLYSVHTYQDEEEQEKDEASDILLSLKNTPSSSNLSSVQSSPTKKFSLSPPKHSKNEECNAFQFEEDKPSKLDQRTGSVPGILKEWRPVPYQSKKSLEPPNIIRTRHTVAQEFFCRDCKKPFCRKGDRDNHEKRLGHEKWRLGSSLKLQFA